MKNILLVTYGGGHVKMVIPVTRELIARKAYSITILALTTAPAVLEKNNLEYVQFKNFFNINDNRDARILGESLASKMHNDSAGIDLEESITYLGLSYMELVEDNDKAEADRKFKKYGRQSLLPVRSLGHIIDTVSPDMVVTTNSPRAERAAVIAAKRRNIRTLSMVDLFGDTERYKLCADYITVFSESAKHNLINAGIDADSIYITGNPAFDSISRHTGPVDSEWRRKHLDLSETRKVMLWAEKRSYMDRGTGRFHERSENEIVADLDAILEACSRNNISLLIRTHPSQRLEIFYNWISDKSADQAMLANEYSLHPLINAVDYVGSFNSTVLVEAVLIGRPIFQVDYTSSDPVLPLDTITDDIWVAKSRDSILPVVTSMNQHDANHYSKTAKTLATLPLDGARNVCDLIETAMS